MKTVTHLLKIAVVLCACGFAVHATNRFLAQRDDMVQIERANFVLKAAELQGSVHCDPS